MVQDNLSGLFLILYTNRLKGEIIAALKINNRMSWQNKLYGRIVPRMDKKDAIKAIFSKYNVKEDVIQIKYRLKWN